jgi:hypothetical protein
MFGGIKGEKRTNKIPDFSIQKKQDLNKNQNQ